MSDRLIRVIAQLLESAAWCYAANETASAAYFLDSATRALCMVDGARLSYGAPPIDTQASAD